MKISLTKLLFYFTVFFSSLSSYAASYYWVGGTGSWTDLTHWATTSGGSTKHTVIPGQTDDVFFDANSFTVGSQVVTLTDEATFRSMDWTGSTNSPKITSTFLADVNVYGSLILPATVVRDFTGNLHFKGTGNLNLGGATLTSANNETLYFEGTGVYTLTGGINIYGISVTGGTLTTNGQNVICSVFGTTGSSAQTLNLGSSNIYVSTWNITSTNMIINAGTSTITSDFAFNGKNLTYNNLIINGNVSVNGSNTFNTITVNAASTLSLTAGTTQTITNLISNGTSPNPATIKSTVAGSQATLSKSTGTVSVNYVRVQDNIATGGATFNAPTGSVNLGNVTGWNITVSTPTGQATSADVSKALKTSMELRWTNGGGASRIVVAKAGSAVSAPPVDLIAYTAGAFGAGTQIGTGNYVVYSGNADRATITGLTANTTYHFAVYEFNGSGTSARFLTASPAIANATTLPGTAIIISNSVIGACTGLFFDTGGNDLYNYNNNENFTQLLTPITAGAKVRLNFSNYDFSLGTGDVLKIYDGETTSSTLIGTYTGSNSPGTVTATNPDGRLLIQFTSDAFITGTGFGADISCFVPPINSTQPTAQATAMTYSNIAGTTVTLGWTNGNGTGRIVVARVGTPVAFTPTDGIEYAANTSYASGASLGSNQYVVYNGNGNSVNITNLAPSTAYYFAVFDFNKAAGTSPNYLLPGLIGGTTTTASATEPTVATSALSIAYRTEAYFNLTWTNGNGVRRVIVMKQGSAVDAIPVDGTLYTSTQNFNTGINLGNGNKVVYSGAGSSTFIEGLSSMSTYHLAVFEFNGTTAGITNYLITNPAIISGSTIAAEPTDIPSFNGNTAKVNAIDLAWTKGNAEKVLIVARIGQQTELPTDGIEYTGNPIFGQGQKIGTDTYVIYSGSAAGITMSGLVQGQQYNLAIHGYNGTGPTVNYAGQAFRSVVSPFKTKPTVQASNVSITNVATDSLRITWQKGNGDLSLVVVRAESPVSFSIKDSTNVEVYTNDFGQGYDLGNGNSAVYVANNSTVLVKSLSPSTTYHVAVYSVNQSRGADGKDYKFYLLSNPPVANAKTLNGKNYYWVKGKGKWSDFSGHWATSSGGSVFHTSKPKATDDVYFDQNSFTTDQDSLIIDESIFFRDMDWTRINKKVFFGPKTNCGFSNVYGSIRLSDLVTAQLGTMYLWGNKKNVIDLANKTEISTCGIVVWGYGGEWTISNDIKTSGLTMYAGTLVTNHKLNISGGISIYNRTLKKLELGDAMVSATGITGGGSEVSNFFINGGKFFFGNTNQDIPLEASKAHFKKLTLSGNLYNKIKLLGGMSIDSLQIDPGREVQFESGKTYTIGQLIVNGDSTKTTIISSSMQGSEAFFYKADGKIDVNYVVLKDNKATGGAEFNARNSVNAGNVSGWNIITPKLYLPKISASAIQFAKVLRTDLQMKWIGGDGTGRVVIARQDNPVNRFPVDNSFYTGQSVFGSGSDLGEGNFIVYNGTSNTLNLSGLTPGKNYHFAILEYNSWDAKIKYKQSRPAIANISTVGASDVIFADNTPVVVCNVKFFDDGGNGYYTRDKNGIQTISPATAGTRLGLLFSYFEAGVYDSLVVYDGPSTTSPVLAKFNSANKPANAIIATNASGVLTIRLKGSNSSETDDAFKGWVGELFCVGTLASEPTINTPSIIVTAKSSNSITLKSGKGNGEARTIIVREAQPVNYFPVDGSSFSKGTHLGNNNYVAYSGADENIVVDGLKQNTIYHFAAFEYNGSSGSTNYSSTGAIVKDTTNTAVPTTPASQLVFSNTTETSTGFNFYTGSGNSRIIVARKNKEVTAVPTDGIEYAYSSSLGGGASLGDSTFVVGNFYSSSVFNLEKSSVYYFKVFEYNGNGKRAKYLKTPAVAGSIRTLGPKITMLKVKEVVCPNGTIEVPFVISSPFDEKSKLVLQLSDEEGSFDTPFNLKDTTIIALSGMIKGKIPNSVNGSGNYKLRIVSSSPKSVSDSIRTISILSVPDVTVTQEGFTFTSSLTSNIQWLKNGVEISGATAATQNFTEPGSYSVKVTEGGCYKTSTASVILGLEDENSNLKIYPNPVKDQLEIETSEEGSGYVIYDVQGRELLKGVLNQRRSVINAKELPSGMLLIKISSGKSSAIRKVIKN